MEDEHRSLPSNYVSLVQLQERWLKEQQRKQREKEEQERKREEDQQKQRRKENGDKGLDNSVSVSGGPFWRNCRNRGARDRNPNSEVSKIEAAVSRDQPMKDELKERVEKKKKKNKRRKPRVEENLAGVTSQAPVEKLQVFVTERNGASEQIESKSWRNGGDQGMNHKVLEPKDQAATVARNVEERSLNDRKECMRSAGKTNASSRQYSSERADRWKLSKQRDCNPVEKLQVFVTERNGESEQIESKFQRNGGDQGVSHKVSEPKVQIDQTALTPNVEELSLNDRKESMRSAGKTNAGRTQYSRGSERADRRKLSKQRDCNPVEKLQVFVTERNGESEPIESKFRRNGGDQGVSHKVSEPKVQIDQVATLAPNVEELSLNDRKESMRSAGKTNAGRRQYSRGSERADHQKLSKQRDCNLVWVKKGEITGTEIQSSGNSVKAGMDKKQQRPGHSKQKYSASRD